MLDTNWSPTSLDLQRLGIKAALARVLPPYKLQYHPYLAENATLFTPKSLTDGLTLHTPNFTIQFQDGRTLTFSTTAQDLRVQRGFTSPTNHPSLKDILDQPALSQIGLIPWDKLPGQEPSAHVMMERISEAPAQKIALKGISGQAWFHATGYSVLVQWSLGGNITLFFGNPMESAAFPPAGHLMWRWAGTDLALVFKTYTQTHPKRMLLWDMFGAFFLLLPKPLKRRVL